MGTSKTAQHKMFFTMSFVRSCADKKEDIIQEKLISYLMTQLFCERRKAIELIKAAVNQFSYTEGRINGERAYLYNFGNPSNAEGTSN